MPQPGGLLVTKDGGDTWRRKPSPHFVFLHFASPDVGWAGTYEDAAAVLLRSRDGGISWDRLPQVDVGSLYSLRSRSHFLSAEDLWVARPAPDNADKYDLLSTTDGGATWEQLASINGRVGDVHRVDAETGWLAASGGLLHTTDGGRTWAALEFAVVDAPRAVQARGRAISAWANLKGHASGTPFGRGGR